MTRWMPTSVRARLTLWSVAVTLIVLGLYASAVYTIVHRNASASLDEYIRSDFRWATEMAQVRPDGSLTWFDGDEWNDASPWLQVWSAEGELVYRTSLARRLPVPQSESLARIASARIVSVPANGTPFRLLAGRVTIGENPVVVQVGRSEALMRQELRELLLVLLLGLPLSVAAAAAGGYSLARRTLAPIDRMAERGQEITAARLHERLPVHNPDDELGRLAAVFNMMLGRLEASFTQVRRFADDVSHELRTPLTAIRSVGEIALRESRDETAYRAVIGSMLEDVDRLTHLTERLLLLSRADDRQFTLSLAPVDLAALAEDVTSQLAVLAEEKDQALVFRCDDGPVACEVDQMVLRQAVVNLVDNAIKYTPDGGTIHVKAGRINGHARLEVTDSGPGVPAHRRARMFDRFDRGGRPESAGGSGLGLAIAKWAVEANLGRLSYETNGEGGSTFRMEFPVKPVCQPTGRHLAPGSRPAVSHA